MNGLFLGLLLILVGLFAYKSSKKQTRFVKKEHLKNGEYPSVLRQEK